jgi:thiamine biosynthesis protein ThiI
LKDLLMVRYSELGTKSGPVQSKMKSVLRQRVQDRLEYEQAEIDKVKEGYGRIYADIENPGEHAEAVAEVPGVSTVSPCWSVEADLEEIKNTLETFEIGETFAVRVNTAETDFSSQELERELGGYIDSRTDASVDLDNPESKLEVDIRGEKAYVFDQRIEGTPGLPVGTAGEVVGLVSGGIDSPVAVHEMMTRGADVTPIYFYNRPIAAEDHLMRFKASMKKLKRFHPGKNWEAVIVDMEEVNEQLMELGKGRMVVHRRIMFRVAERIAESDGLNGIVTGESLSQKSSQTLQNLETSSRAADMPVHRPLLSMDKHSITERARKIRTFEEASINSACRSLSPESPSTSMSPEEAERLEEQVNVEELVDTAIENSRRISL